MSPSDALHTTNDRDTAVQLSDERDIAILTDLEAGLSYRDIARKHGVSTTPVARIALKMRVHKGAVQKLLIAKSLDALDDWERARGKAADRGDHRPAKDWLLHAQEIEPIADSPKLGIQINVGNGGAPVQAVNDIPTISVQPVDPKALTGE